MSLFTNLFGGGDPLKRVRRALEQNQWADALALGEGIDRKRLDGATLDELNRLLHTAGDRLAELNLTEGEACLRAGDRERAWEHFSLAVEQARDEGLRRRALEARETEPVAVALSPPKNVAGSCATCGPKAEGPPPVTDDLDPAVRLELLLASLPPVLGRRYEAKSEDFLNAAVLAHQGEEEQALACFDALPESERDDLFHFERGSVLVRLGRSAEGKADLEEVLRLCPDHLPALDLLLTLEIAAGDYHAAEARIRPLVESGTADGFALARLALILARKQDFPGALSHGLQAVEAGSRDPELLLFCASLLEKEGHLDRAEGVLGLIPTGGGCSGQVNVALAEFWLRHGRQLDRALETFKKCLREEPENGRWPLRLGQAYWAKGWKKEAVPLLQRALTDPALDHEQRQAARGLLDLRSAG